METLHRACECSPHTIKSSHQVTHSHSALTFHLPGGPGEHIHTFTTYTPPPPRWPHQGWWIKCFCCRPRLSPLAAPEIMSGAQNCHVMEMWKLRAQKPTRAEHVNIQTRNLKPEGDSVNHGWAALQSAIINKEIVSRKLLSQWWEKPHLIFPWHHLRSFWNNFEAPTFVLDKWKQFW